jgi:hypothetical protein
MNRLQLDVEDAEVQHKAATIKTRPYQSAVTPYNWAGVEQLTLHNNILAFKSSTGFVMLEFDY